MIKTTDISFKDKVSINLGGTRCEILKVNDLHTDDSVIIHIPSEKVLFVGDWLYPTSKHNVETIRGKVLETIDMMGRLDFEVCFISHQEPMSKEQLMQWIKNSI